MRDRLETPPAPPPVFYEPPPWSAFWVCELQRSALAVLALVAILALSR
jgi:hypothetical protein